MAGVSQGGPSVVDRARARAGFDEDAVNTSLQDERHPPSSIRLVLVARRKHATVGSHRWVREHARLLARTLPRLDLAELMVPEKHRSVVPNIGAAFRSMLGMPGCVLPSRQCLLVKFSIFAMP
jgi:hypothetical protein